MSGSAVTVTGGREWLVTLVNAVRDVPDETRSVVQRGCLNIKNDWRKAWSGHPHIPALPYAISYDTEDLANAVTGEIGPDKNKPQGELGNIIEFGSPLRQAPIPGGLPALEAEVPRFEKALADAGAQLLEKP